MKVRSIAAAVLATLPTAVPAVYLNSDGIGQALVYPYYTAQSAGGNPFNTYISVVNHSADAKALRVRFREGRMGAEVGSFNLFLSANDVWTGAIIPVFGGGANLITRDGSCRDGPFAVDFSAPGSPPYLEFRNALYTDLPLPVDARAKDRCGSCTACLPACPTGAITAPYQLDARRCISYLTIEHHGSIPEELRPAIGNRIFGCDDCQLVCPWNKFARVAAEPDFRVRHRLDEPDLVDLFGWSESEYLENTRGSALRRLGFRRWLRNLAIALGNAPGSPRAAVALRARSDTADPVVREAVAWALARQGVRPAAD